MSYCPGTTYCQFSSLKQHALIIALFLWVPGVWAQLYWVFTQSPKDVIKASAELWFLDGTWDPSSKLIQVAGRIQFLEDVGQTYFLAGCWRGVPLGP